MLVGLCSVVGVPSAGAVFPGANGRIAVVTEFYYDSGCGDCDPEGQRVWMLARRGRTASMPGRAPMFSPSGSRIAYESGRSIVVAHHDLSRRVFTRSGSEPVWSPSGRELAYRRYWSYRVVVVQANGSNRRGLPAIQAPFAWAPTGGELAWIDSSSIRAIGSDGRGARQIVALDGSTAALDWLPSGWLAYQQPNVSSPSEAQLVIHRPGDFKRVLVTGVTVQYPYEPYSWSPDGRRVAFFRDGGLWVATVPDAREHLVARTGSAARLPQWSPDGRLIAYVRGHRVRTVRAAGGQPRLFARFNDRRSGEEYAVDIDWQPRPRD
jgi:Tol biopolymer transport system component